MLVEILFSLAMYLAIDSKNICVEFVRSIACADALDPGIPSVKQVTVDMIPQLARQREVVSRPRALCALPGGGHGSVLIVYAERKATTNRHRYDPTGGLLNCGGSVYLGGVIVRMESNSCVSESHDSCRARCGGSLL